MRSVIAFIGACLLTVAPLAAYGQEAPFRYITITPAQVTACSTAATTLYIGIHNNSASAQTATITIYDGTVAQGNIIDTIAAPGAGVWIAPPQPGFPVQTNLLTACPSAAVSATNVQILVK